MATIEATGDAGTTAQAERPLTVRPTDDRVLLKRLDAEEKTPGGILLAPTSQEPQLRGRVVAVGPGKLVEQTGYREPVGARVGEVVLFARFAGIDVEIGGVPHLILRESEILGVVGED